MPPKAAGAKKAVGGGGSETDRIVKMKDSDGKTWAEIAETLGKAQGKCMFMYELAKVDDSTRITGRNDDEIKKKVAKARADGVSWGVVAARSGQTEGFCKKAFEELTGESARGHRIGKGGRYPNGEGPDPSDKPAKAKGATKKAAKANGAVKKATKAAPVKKGVKKTAKKVAKSAA